MNNPLPDTSHSRIGDFYAYILYLSCAYIVLILCHSPIPCHAHTTQAQDNFSFVYDILAGPQPHLPKLYKSITADISCAYPVSHCSPLSTPPCCPYTSRHPIPHYPADHSPTLPHKPFPEIPQIPPLYRKTAPPNRRQQLKHAQLSTYLSHLYCAYHMLFLCLPCVTAYSRIYFT